MKAISGKKYTARELAAQFGCSVDTIQNHANRLFGKGTQGVTRFFDKAQVTLLLESIKRVKQAGGRRTSETDSEVKEAERETMKAISGKKYTVRELAAQFGCSARTIQNHANKLFGKEQNGIKRSFDEAQTTMLLENIKTPKSSGTKSNLETEIRGTETKMTLDLQIAMAEKVAKQLWKKKAEQNEARAVKAEAALGRLTVEHKDALEANTMLWNIAEAGGLITSDHEDMLALYRR